MVLTDNLFSHGNLSVPHTNWLGSLSMGNYPIHISPHTHPLEKITKLYTGYMYNKFHILAQWTVVQSAISHRAMSGQPTVGRNWPCTIPITRNI